MRCRVGNSSNDSLIIILISLEVKTTLAISDIETTLQKPNPVRSSRLRVVISHTANPISDCSFSPKKQ